MDADKKRQPLLLGRESRVRGAIRGVRTGWKIPFALVKRRALDPDIIVGITGSAGKSTTTRILAHILATRFTVHTSEGVNTSRGVKRYFFHAPLNHNAWVQEVSGHTRSEIDRTLSFLRPKMGIVTTIGLDHRKQLGSLEEIRDNKQKLIQSLPSHGVAILNIDDELVASMARVASSKVITYGENSRADVRLLSTSTDDIGQLAMNVQIDGEEHLFATKFVGQRWCVSVLAAIAGAQTLHIDVPTIAKAVLEVEPELYKDSIHHANGVTYMLDCFKAPYWTLPSSFETVANVSAKRKILILGTLSDYTGASRKKYTAALIQALKAADIVITFGPHAYRARRKFDLFPDRVFPFERFSELQAFLKNLLKPGDFIYIKGSGVDHLERIWHDVERPIDCLIDNCKRGYTCNWCKKLYPDGVKLATKSPPHRP